MNNGHLRDLVNVLKRKKKHQSILFMLSLLLSAFFLSVLFQTLEENFEGVVGKLDRHREEGGEV